MASHVQAPSSPGAYRSFTTPETGPLPREYGVTRLALLPRDPRWMHAYWEIARYTWDEARRNFGDDMDQGRPVLRIFSSRSGVREHFDVDIRLDARQWYIYSPHPDGDWHAELGLMLADGRFVLLAISNWVRLPAGSVADLAGPDEERWGILKGNWERLFELSGGGRIGASSFDLARSLIHRWDLLRGASSSGLSSWGSAARARPEARPKSFWLIAECELTVYGATEPDAVVTFRGEPVNLNPDGTFSFRLPLPDGQQTLPLRATNAEGDLARAIGFEVTRRSEKGE